jgi:hypothetical protein
MSLCPCGTPLAKAPSPVPRHGPQLPRVPASASCTRSSIIALHASMSVSTATSAVFDGTARIRWRNRVTASTQVFSAMSTENQCAALLLKLKLSQTHEIIFLPAHRLGARHAGFVALRDISSVPFHISFLVISTHLVNRRAAAFPSLFHPGRTRRFQTVSPPWPRRHQRTPPTNDFNRLLIARHQGDAFRTSLFARREHQP